MAGIQAGYIALFALVIAFGAVALGLIVSLLKVQKFSLFDFMGQAQWDFSSS